MKKSFLFYILACMTSLFIFSSCEDNTDQVTKAQPDNTKEITNRTILDCDDCPQDPVEHCCCAVEIVEALEDVELVLCGVFPMTIGSACGPISPPSPCGTISGTSSLISLTSLSSSAFFCVPIGGSFSIFQSGGGPSKLRVTCQAGQFNPQWMQINIDGTTFYFDTNGNCMLALCE